MTSTTSNQAEEFDYDPDSPDRGFIGKLVISALVIGDKVSPSYGDADARIVQNCATYAAKAANYDGPLWFLEAEGVDVARSDGPFLQRDILKLKSAKGSNLGVNMAPDIYATQYRTLDVTASYIKVGQADSAIGRVFDFGTHDIKMGKHGEFKKPVRLWPRAIMPEGYTYEGDVRVIPARTDDSTGTPANGPAQIDEAEVIELIKTAFVGRTPADLLQAVLDDVVLRTVPTVFGVPLLDAATDESIVSVLSEHRVMALAANGTLVAL